MTGSRARVWHQDQVQVEPQMSTVIPTGQARDMRQGEDTLVAGLVGHEREQGREVDEAAGAWGAEAGQAQEEGWGPQPRSLGCGWKAGESFIPAFTCS